MIPTSPVDTLELKEGSNEDDDDLDEHVHTSRDGNDLEIEDNPSEKVGDEEEP